MSELHDDHLLLGLTHRELAEAWKPRVDGAPPTWPESGFDWLDGELLTAIGRGARELEAMRAFLRAERHALGREDELKRSLARLVAADMLRREGARWMLSEDTAKVLDGAGDEVWAQRRAFYLRLQLR